MLQLKQLFWPGTMMMGRLLLPPPLLPGGGPQDGVSGEMGKKPGSLLPPLPEGGPQEGVSGEMGKKPGSVLPQLPEGGPQDGVSGEMGANPGEELPKEASVVSVVCVPSALSEAERVRFSPFLSIYIGFPFCLIADANGMIYPMRNVADSVTVFKIFWIFFPTAKRQPRWRLPH